MLTEIMGNFAAKLSYSTLSRFATFCLILSSFDHHGCESRAGQEPPAKSLPPGTYIAELPNNIQVELVALAPGASKRNDEPIWWMPDGRALDVAPKYAGGQIDGNVPPYVRSVIHVHGIRDSGGVTANVAASTVDSEKNRLGRPFVAHYGITDVLKGQKTRSFEVGVASEALSSLRSLDIAGKRLRPPVNVRPDDIAEDISVEKVGQGTWGTRDMDGRTLIVDPAGPGDVRNGSAEKSTQVTLQIPREWRTIDLRMRAIDKSGKPHPVSATLRLDSTAERKVLRLAKVFDIPFNQVDRFEYEFRLFRHWVTFENVALQLGLASEVNIKVATIQPGGPEKIRKPNP